MNSTIGELIDYILFLVQNMGPCSLSSKILVILSELRIPAEGMGAVLLKGAILSWYEAPARALSGDIYRELALLYPDCSEYKVEREIRRAIERGWENGSPKAWARCFSYEGELPEKRPTNAEFISRAVYILELWSGFEEDRKAPQGH